MNKTEIPDWVIYPQEKWVQITPGQAGFDPVKFELDCPGDSQVKGARWEGEVHEEKEWGQSLLGAVTWCGSGGIQPTNTKQRLYNSALNL